MKIHNFEEARYLDRQNERNPFESGGGSSSSRKNKPAVPFPAAKSGSSKKK